MAIFDVSLSKSIFFLCKNEDLMKKTYEKILIIQTAFIGDVILATAILEKLYVYYPEAEYTFLVRKGNEMLLQSHPFLKKVLVWDKTQNKYKNFWKVLKQIRAEKYDLVVNLQRFASSGIFMAFSGAKEKVCFNKNPFAWLANRKVTHEIGKGIHEIDRNQTLIAYITDEQPAKPKLYPSNHDFEIVQPYQESNYICIAPASVWFTKQFPIHKWIDFVRLLPMETNIYLLGAKSDFELCEEIKEKSKHPFLHNLAGKLNLLASAALMQKSIMNYVNDSAPLHLASALNAPVCAVYCSTVTDFGFYPVAEKSYVIETAQNLPCRPCGLHGYKTCPKGHFACAESIDTQKMADLMSV
jgi:heptosyltransferase-2